MGKLGSLLLLVCIALPAWSAESFNQSNIQLFRPPPTDKSFLFQWDISLTQTRYSGAPQIVEQGQNYSSIIPSFQLFRQWGASELAHSKVYADGLVVFPMSDGVDFGVALPEFYYLRSSEGRQNSLIIGRKVRTWSELDSYWKLGLWQPLVRWDAANPIEQGLTGLYWEHAASLWRGTLFASGLNLPDQQPGYQEKDGKIVSPNRWFRAPVSQGSLQNTNADIRYNVQEPNAQEVILQPSVAGSLEIGREEQGGYARLSYANKPMNQFHLALKGAFDIGTTDFSVPVVPQIVRHKVLSTELGLRSARDKFVISSTLENFEKPTVPEGWEQTELIDSRYSGVIYQRDLEKWGIKRSELSLSYVRRNKEPGGSGKSTNIQGDIEASTQRFQFDEMAGLRLQMNLLRTYKRELDMIMRYVYSVEDQGEWLQAGILYRQDRRWYWNVSLDVFGVPEETPAGTSFISKFRGNDRLSGGVTYVF